MGHSVVKTMSAGSLSEGEKRKNATETIFGEIKGDLPKTDKSSSHRSKAL